MAKLRMMLFFGSFNPVHKGHIALAEYAVERGLCDQVAMIISPHNPFKQSWAQAAETDRLEMVEAACKASKYPEQIVPSIIEFLLEKPSYTVNTLRHLKENYGSQMEFSILMGSDLINQLPRWRDAEEIIKGFDIYYRVDCFEDKFSMYKELANINYTNMNYSTTAEKLYLNIMKMCMIDKDDPIKAWKEHIDKNNYFKNKLNELEITGMHYRNSLGTDFYVEKDKDTIWINSDKTDYFGNRIISNMPSYEIFTTPDCRKTKGVVYSSRPLIYNGVLIDDFYLKFDDGKVVDCGAGVGENVLNT